MFYTAWREVDGKETSKWPKLQYTSYNCAWPVVCRINIVWHLMLNLKKGLILVRHSKHCTSTQVHIKIQWKQRFERWGVDVRRRQSQGRLALYLRTSPTGTGCIQTDKSVSKMHPPCSFQWVFCICAVGWWVLLQRHLGENNCSAENWTWHRILPWLNTMPFCNEVHWPANCKCSFHVRCPYLSVI